MSLPCKPAAVIFDMDGLLFNTEVLSFESAASAALHHGHEIDWPLFKTLIGCQWPDIRLKLVAHLGPSFPVDDFRPTWIDHYSQLLALRLDIKPGVIEILDILDELSIPRAIATSSPREKMLQKIGTFGIENRFHALVAQGDYPNGKPSPDPFLTAAARLSVEPHLCLALEDSHNGIRSAHAAGMMAVMIPDLLDPTDEIVPLCTAVVSDLHRVVELIRLA